MSFDRYSFSESSWEVIDSSMTMTLLFNENLQSYRLTISLAQKKHLALMSIVNAD